VLLNLLMQNVPDEQWVCTGQQPFADLEVGTTLILLFINPAFHDQGCQGQKRRRWIWKENRPYRVRPSQTGCLRTDEPRHGLGDGKAENVRASAGPERAS